jgi:hypothetical protein
MIERNIGYVYPQNTQYGVFTHTFKNFNFSHADSIKPYNRENR